MGKENQSWFQEHPLLTFVIVIFGMLFLTIFYSIVGGTQRDITTTPAGGIQSEDNVCQDLYLECLDSCGTYSQCNSMKEMEDCEARLKLAVKGCKCVEDHSLEYCSAKLYTR